MTSSAVEKRLPPAREWRAKGSATAQARALALLQLHASAHMECAPLSPGPLSRGERAEDQARRGARTMRARFPAYTDVRSENLRSPLANPEGRMPGGRGSGVHFLLVTSLCARKEK